MLDQAQFDRFLTTLKFPPNPFQLKVLESIAFGSGNIVVSALAGSGKTSLLVQTASLLAAMGDTSATYLAFNTKIRDELNQRLPKPFVAINSHSLGNKMLRGVNSKTTVDANKYRTIAEEAIEELYLQREQTYTSTKLLEKLCSKVMLNNVDPTDIELVVELANTYRLGVEDDPQLTWRVAGLVAKAIKTGTQLWEKTGKINFDEMIYLPVIRNLKPPTFNWIFVDEMQDLNILQQEIAFRSIAAGGRFIGVGDLKQAIYFFAGADAASFQRIIDRTDALVLPLNTCYRCPKTHVELARKLVPEIEAAPNAVEGIIEYADPKKLPDLAKKGNLIMCRLNAPLVSAYFDFIKRNIPAKVMGKDIGKDLVNTIKRVANFDGFRYERMIEYLEKYREQQVAMLQQKKNAEQQIELLHDKVDCLIVCVENNNCTSLQCLIDVLESLFGDDDKENWGNLIVLCSIHKAKGLEADETFILRPDKLPLVWKDQSPTEWQQELNAFYVALTRAKKKLTVLGALNLNAQQPALPAPVVPALVSPVSEKSAAVEPKSPLPALEPVNPLPMNGRPSFDTIKANFMAAATPEPKPEPVTPEPQQLTLLSPDPSPLLKLISEMTAADIRNVIAVLEAAAKEKEAVA